MKIVKPSFEIVTFTPDAIEIIEKAGRCCYQSGTSDASASFVRGLIKQGHHSVIEHASVTVKLIVDRGVSHELVRHRLASYSQESTRYVNYKDQDMQFIQPQGLKLDSYAGDCWMESMCQAEKAYKAMLANGCSPQVARSVLPNALKTEIYMTANMREWRHIFQLRTSNAAHPDIRYIMLKVLAKFKELWPALFGDIMAFQWAGE